MTLQTCGRVAWPYPLIANGLQNSVYGTSNITFDSTSDRIAFVMQSAWSDTVSKIHFRVGTVTTGCTIQAQIESLSAGRPSGSAIAGGASGTVAVSTSNTWYTVTITTPPTISVGTKFAIVFTYSSGSTPSFSFLRASNFLSIAGQWPLMLQDTGAGSWSAPATSPIDLVCILELTTAGVVQVPGMQPWNSSSTTSYYGGSSPNEYAAKFTMPFSCRAIGISAPMVNIGSGADFTISLWPSSSTTDSDALAQSSYDGGYPAASTTDGLWMSPLSTPVTLTAGSTYYMGLRSDDSTSNTSTYQISVVRLGVPSGITNAINGYLGNITFESWSRSWSGGSAGSWSQNTNEYIPFNLTIDQLDDAAGGGSSGTPSWAA